MSDNDNKSENEEQQNIPTYAELTEKLSKEIEKTRVKSGRAVEDIAYQINIPVPNLIGMENGTAYDTMEKVFVRGYLINYAKALDLDNTDLMELLNAVYIARDNQDAPQGKGGKKSKDSKINAPKPIHGYNLQDIENNDSLPLAKIIPPLLITLVVIGGGLYWRFANTPETTSISPLENAQQIEQFEPLYSEEYLNATEDAWANPAEVSEPNTVSFQFLEESWLEVTDSQGKTLAWQLFGPGQAVSFVGSPPYTIVIGNSRGTVVSYDDFNIDVRRFSDAENVARFVLPNE
ncbi:MAG: helix-turn-helix domain-containing protein [Gammaproteobacteria bacterium]|nr:helix-turn-helix domain-containing protein [Gammaproteobacteria bacterium]